MRYQEWHEPTLPASIRSTRPVPLVAPLPPSSLFFGQWARTPSSTSLRTSTAGRNSHSGEDLKRDFFPARRDDDAELRRILRQSPVGTRVSFTLEREPSFFDGEGAWGDSTRTGVLKTAQPGPPLGLVSRSTVPVYLGGRLQRVGFIHSVRLPGDDCSAAAAAFLRSVREPDDAPIDLLPVLEEEVGVWKTLLKPAPGLPPVRLAGSASVFLVSVRAIDLRYVNPVSGLAIPAIIPDLLACLERNGRRAALAPAWRTLDFEGSLRRRDLQVSDFFVQLKGNDVRGCISVWDQSAFKQTVIRSYSRPGAPWARPVMTGLDRRSLQLPAVGSPLRFASISHLAIDGDDPGLFHSLIAAACGEARRRRLDYIALVLNGNDPLADALRSFVRTWELPVKLLAVLWGDAQKELEAIDAGPIRPGPLLL